MVKVVRERFFNEFAESHREWLNELVTKYKARDVYPVFPTQIVEYYKSREDKEIAVFASLCMNWQNGKELEQIASMRKLMGESPSQWFFDRHFVAISVAREQNNYIDGYMNAKYWKIAKVFDRLYDVCKDRNKLMLPSDAFKKKSFKDFCMETSDICELPGMEYKSSITELVLRTSDGIGRGLWPTTPYKVKCPCFDKIKRYLVEWFPFYRTGLWSWDDAVSLMGLRPKYDFFYAYLAHQELAITDPVGCRKYTTRYQSRWEKCATYPRRYWLGAWGIAPKIVFE